MDKRQSGLSIHQHIQGNEGNSNKKRSTNKLFLFSQIVTAIDVESGKFAQLQFQQKGSWQLLDVHNDALLLNFSSPNKTHELHLSRFSTNDFYNCNEFTFPLDTYLVHKATVLPKLKQEWNPVNWQKVKFMRERGFH